MNAFRRVWRWIVDREWAMAIAIVTAVVAELPALAELVSGEFERAGDDFTWRGLMIVVAGLIIRLNVWAAGSVKRIREAADRVQPTLPPVDPAV